MKFQVIFSLGNGLDNRYYNNIKNINKDFQKPIAQEKEVIVLWGWPGTGKSKMALEKAQETGEPYYKDVCNKWWDGYQQEETVIFDDFDGNLRLTDLLKWMDRYKMSGEIKGGRVALNYKRLIITSNSPPDEWYPLISVERLEAIKRRIRKITYFHKDGIKWEDVWCTGSTVTKNGIINTTDRKN